MESRCQKTCIHHVSFQYCSQGIAVPPLLGRGVEKCIQMQVVTRRVQGHVDPLSLLTNLVPALWSLWAILVFTVAHPEFSLSAGCSCTELLDCEGSRIWEKAGNLGKFAVAPSPPHHLPLL
jgi:hypothetical protein